MEDEQAAKRVRELEARLADLEKRMPAHSVPASLLLQLEELEDELARARESLAASRREPLGGKPWQTR